VTFDNVLVVFLTAVDSLEDMYAYQSICSAVCSAIQWQNSNCPVRITPGSPFPQRSSGDCLEGKRENYQVCSVQYCAQQLCTVPSTHLSVVCWLGLAFLWLYCVLQFICIRCSFLGLFFLVLYLYMCAFVVLDLVFFLYYATRLARKNVSEITYFVSSGT